MKEVSLEDIKRAMRKREAERLANPPKLTFFNQTPKKIKKEPSHNIYDIGLQAFIRLYCFRNVECFSIKHLKVLPDDDLNNLYKRVNYWTKCGFIEKFDESTYVVTESAKAKLEAIFDLLNKHQHGKGIEE